jgi:hypothetical protein
MRFGLDESLREHLDPIADAKIEAARLFSLLLLTDARFSISRCRYTPCSRYFNAPRVRTWAHGTCCCRQHNKAYSATKSTKNRRKECHRRLINVAAEKSLEWGGKSLRWRQLNGPMGRWIARAVTKFISDSKDPTIRNHNKVTAKWVTQNLGEIEQCAARQALRNAQTSHPS